MSIMDISKCFRGSLRLRDKESRMYMFLDIENLITNQKFDQMLPKNEARDILIQPLSVWI